METKMYYLLALVIWSIPWKGFALWKSARRGEGIWFVFLLLLNTAGILEIVYLFFFSSKEKVQPRKERTFDINPY